MALHHVFVEFDYEYSNEEWKSRHLEFMLDYPELLTKSRVEALIRKSYSSLNIINIDVEITRE